MRDAGFLEFFEAVKLCILSTVEHTEPNRYDKADRPMLAFVARLLSFRKILTPLPTSSYILVCSKFKVSPILFVL